MFKPTREFLHRLPKTDLHVHLDGSLRLETILDLAQSRGVKLPSDTPEGLAKTIKMGEQCEDLNDYLKGFDVTLSVLQDEEALTRAAFELAEDAALENVRVLEVRYAPILHTQKGLPMTRIVEAVLHGLHEARRQYGIIANVIICGIRHIDPTQSLRLAELAVAYKNRGVVGFDLAGAEYDYPAKAHREAFYLVRNNNVNSTVHAGEASGPASIHQALHVCGAHRIGHGTRLREDGDLLNYVCDWRIPLEICLKSNVQTNAVTDIYSHPLKFYFDLGLRVTINTDNRLITKTSVTDELVLACQTFGFTVPEVKQLLINGFKSAFLPFHRRQALLRQVATELDKLIAEEQSRADREKSGKAAPKAVATAKPATA